MGPQPSPPRPTDAAPDGAGGDAAPGCSDARWAVILDRIEHRQAGLGLRFSSSPLWLEVTMAGPDSDTWTTAGVDDRPDRPWNWQSSAPCAGITEAVGAGADDDALLGLASRYTLENLVLNAVHEIGEWFRFDATRVFPAHGPRPGPDASGDGVQGNGVVAVTVEFAPGPPALRRRVPAPLRTKLRQRAGRLAAGWRFAALPGTVVSYGPDGPEVTGGGRVGDGTPRPDAPAERSWGVPWSAATVAAADAADGEFTGAVIRDVHRLLILREAERICDTLHVDGRRPWVLRTGTRSAPGRAPVTLSVRYGPPDRLTA